MSSPTSRHPTEPCSNCPYRKDAPLHHWDQREFVKLLVEDEKQLGSLYACHGHVKLNNKSRGFCAGWLLDQKKRRVPSIRLRLQLHVSAEARKAYELVNDGGHKLFRTVKAMCRANGVKMEPSKGSKPPATGSRQRPTGAVDEQSSLPPTRMRI